MKLIKYIEHINTCGISCDHCLRYHHVDYPATRRAELFEEDNNNKVRELALCNDHAWILEEEIESQFRLCRYWRKLSDGFWTGE